MNFYTLEYDCNTPVTQQVNAPTNTDYKVGLKVKRNGEVQQLGPDEFTIYTGEINVIPPTQFTTETKECENSSAMQFLNLKDDALSAVAGKRIKSTDIWVEFSFDNGTTWTKGIGGTDTIPVKVNDRSAGSNNYIASVNLSNPSKWTLLDHNIPTGEYADYVTVPEVPYIMIQFLGSLFTNITSYPCLWRLVFLYGGQEIPVTIPTDADKTNGYVTFTQASNDDASFRQLKVVVDTRVPGDKKVVDYIAQMTDKNVPRALSASVDEEGLVGQYYGKDGEVDLYYWNSASQPPEDYTQWTKMTPAGSGTKLVKCADGSLWLWRDLPEPMVIEGKTYDAGYWFLHTNTAGTAFVEGAKSILLQSGDYLISGTYRYTANNWLGITACVDIPPTGFKADFKLNVNEFKSQTGDLNPKPTEFETVNFAGTDGDGEAFSYDIVIK